MARLPTAARQAVARRTRPTRSRLVACVLLGVRRQADTTPDAAPGPGVRAGPAGRAAAQELLDDRRACRGPDSGRDAAPAVPGPLGRRRGPRRRAQLRRGAAG